MEERTQESRCGYVQSVWHSYSHSWRQTPELGAGNLSLAATSRSGGATGGHGGHCVRLLQDLHGRLRMARTVHRYLLDTGLLKLHGHAPSSAHHGHLSRKASACPYAGDRRSSTSLVVRCTWHEMTAPSG